MLVIFAQRLLTVALAFSLLALTACGGPSRNIVGKWRTSEDPNAMVWEFSKNGSLQIGQTRSRYSFGDNNRVKIETPFATSVYQMEFFDDRMILHEVNGSKLEFTRVKDVTKQ
jgi:hypothetical protein